MNQKRSLLCVVTGMYHSGTTLISKIICSHPKIFSGFEIGILNNDIERYPLAKPHYDWMTHSCNIGHWGIHREDMEKVYMSNDYYHAYDRIKEFAGTIGDPIFRKLFKEADYIVDKTPHYIFNLVDIMQKVDVPFIITIKPYDMLYHSYVEKRKISEEKFLSMYEKATEQLKGALIRFPDRILVIRYQNLITDTEKEINRIRIFLGIHDQEELSLEKFYHKIEKRYNLTNDVGGTDLSKLRKLVTINNKIVSQYDEIKVLK